MRVIGILLFLPCMAAAQVPSPENAALVRGVLLECDARASGELSIRVADNQGLRYQFDRKTYVEREERLIEPMLLLAAEKAEVLYASVCRDTLRYARTLNRIQPFDPPR